MALNRTGVRSEAAEGLTAVSWLARLRASFGKARDSLSAVQRLGQARQPLDAAFWTQLEELLILADFGLPTTAKLVTGLQAQAKRAGWRTSDQAVAQFRSQVEGMLTLPGAALKLEGEPAVILIVGVNGSGKTTTAGKLALRLRHAGKRVLLVAADTFRAAASEQLTIWAERAGSEIVSGAGGADPSSVVFDGLRAGRARGADVILVDTAGRLQTKTNLMEELKKMHRVIERELGRPPVETLLVVDGTTGQNAISQANLFNEATKLTGIVITKLDSTAKGGVLVAIVDALGVPVKFVGLGEAPDALHPFSPAEFLDALLPPSTGSGQVQEVSAAQ